MKITINKDFEQAFPSESFAGFTLKQCVSALIGLLLAAVTALLLWHYTGLGIVECTYIGIPLMLPVCALGFYSYQGQSPWQMIKEMKYVKNTKLLLYEAEEEKRMVRKPFCMKRTEIRYGGRRKNHGDHKR